MKTVLESTFRPKREGATGDRRKLQIVSVTKSVKLRGAERIARMLCEYLKEHVGVGGVTVIINTDLKSCVEKLIGFIWLT
jgi:hypothetical protein